MSTPMRAVSIAVQSRVEPTQAWPLTPAQTELFIPISVEMRLKLRDLEMWDQWRESWGGLSAYVVELRRLRVRSRSVARSGYRFL